MIKILLLLVCIVAAYSLPYPDHHEGHEADQGKLVPSSLAHSDEKPNLQGKLVPTDTTNPTLEPEELAEHHKGKGLLSKPGDDKDKSDLERSEFFWGGWNRPYYYSYPSYYYSYPTYYYRTYWW